MAKSGNGGKERGVMMGESESGEETGPGSHRPTDCSNTVGF